MDRGKLLFHVVEKLVHRRSGFAVFQDFVHGVKAQHAVAFQLRLAEPLVARRLVRESGMRGGVITDVDRLVLLDQRLDVNELSVLSSLVHFVVANLADGEPRQMARLVCPAPES